MRVRFERGTEHSMGENISMIENASRIVLDNDAKVEWVEKAFYSVECPSSFRKAKQSKNGMSAKKTNHFLCWHPF